MKKRLTLIVFLLTLGCANFVSASVNLDSVDYYLSKQSNFDHLKEEKISQIKEKINQSGKSPAVLYPLYVDLHNKYSSYIYDSASVCVEKLTELSYALNDKEKIASSTVKRGSGYLYSGLFKECFDILSDLDVQNCSNETKIDYYILKSRLYYDLADYNNRPDFREQYDRMGNEIIDSAIALLPEKSSRYWLCLGLRKMKSNDKEGAINAYKTMIDTHSCSEHEFAIATSSIAYLLDLQGNKKEAEKYLIEAAISDIKTSTKEAVALRNLAKLLYERGDLTRSAKYIRQALTDAYFYNARHRQLEIGYILPIIEGERMNVIETQRDRITTISIFISILLVALIIAFFIIWKQLKDLNKAKQIIQKSNENLTDVNNNLIEANKIKDEYIGYFFSLNSEFIDKLEAFQKFVKRKVASKQFDELNYIPKHLDAQNEREALYSRFDQVFLKLFPDFVIKFNELLKPEEQIQLKKGELLNTDLRIYALIRLGINDNEKIAQFLGYSVNTIYTYKTKIKNKALASNEEFKQKVMEIKSI